MVQTRIVLGLDEPRTQEEVLRFLSGVAGLEVVDTASSADLLVRAIRDERPDAVVAGPETITASTGLDAGRVLVVSERETTAALRSAVRARADGFFLWPEERDDLARAAAPGRRVRSAGSEGRVIAVQAARGGAGATFVATTLAAALAARGTETIALELDLFYGDLTPALGLAPGADAPGLAELAPVADELEPEDLERTLYRHPGGFDALLASPRDRDLPGPAVASVLRALRACRDVVVAHLPRGRSPAATAVLESADVILLVISLDVFAFRAARRALDHLEELGLTDRVQLVVNRASRAHLSPRDAERILGLAPLAVVPADRAVPRAQDRGELVTARSSRAARRIRALAETLLEEPA